MELASAAILGKLLRVREEQPDCLIIMHSHGRKDPVKTLCFPQQ